MTRPICAGSDVEKHCERAVVRYREGKGYCLFHPDSEPPALDPKTGRPLHPTPLKQTVPAPELVIELPAEPEHVVEPEPVAPAATADPDGMLELQADLDELERTDPTVAAAAASYDSAVDRILATPLDPALIIGPPSVDDAEPEAESESVSEPEPVESEHPTDANDTPAQPATDLLTLQIAWKVVSGIAGGSATQPATRHVAREARRALGVLVDQLRHDNPQTVRSKPPTAAADKTAPRRRGPNRTVVPVDEADAARRYQAGTPLFDLATELHIGVNRLRTILTGQGVTLRKRGEVVGRRGVEPRALDVDEAQRLYESGMDSAQVARRLGVKQSRVQDALRERGVLGRALQASAPLDETRAREMYAAGHNLSNVAHALGVRTSRVADLLREHGELRPPGTPTRQPVDA